MKVGAISQQHIENISTYIIYTILFAYIIWYDLIPYTFLFIICVIFDPIIIYGLDFHTLNMNFDVFIIKILKIALINYRT